MTAYERLMLSNQLFTIRIISKKDNGDQARTHKKKRINKKWRKRYGLVSAPLEKGQIVALTCNELLMSRKTYWKLKQRLHWKESR